MKRSKNFKTAVMAALIGTALVTGCTGPKEAGEAGAGTQSGAGTQAGAVCRGRCSARSVRLCS